MIHNRSKFLLWFGLPVLLLAAGLTLTPTHPVSQVNVDRDRGPGSQSRVIDEPIQTEVLESYGNLPLAFTANRGQTDEQVKLMARGTTTSNPPGEDSSNTPSATATQSFPEGEFPVTTNPVDQAEPTISGDTVVWIDYRNRKPDIYAYSLSGQREFRITNDTSRPSSLDISDRVVVWYDGRVDAPGIYGYNLSTGHEFPVNTDSNASYAAHMGGPAISGDVVVWSSGFNIRGFNLSTQSSFVIPDVTSLGYEYNPDVFGDVVVWETGFSNPTRRDIHGFDLFTQTDFSITSDFGNTNQMNPAIWNNIVVWQDDRNGNWDIYGYDLSSQTEFQITDNPADQVSPTISGQIVLWQDNRNGTWDLYGYDLDRQIEFPTRTFPADQRNPAIAGNIIVWEDHRNRNGDIYVQQFEYPATALQVEPQLILFNVNDNVTDPAVQEIEISGTGGSIIDWSATPEADWINIDPASGTTPATVNVSIDTSNLYGGAYPWQITVVGQNGGILNTPQSVTVDFPGTEVSGTIDVDTTWNVSGSPYIVVGDVTVNEGVTLTIEPGTGLKFEPNDALSSGVDPDKVELIVAGTLMADGVTFTSNAESPAAGDWYGIRFLPSSTDWDGSGGSIITNSTIQYGTVSVSIDGASPMISSDVIADMKGDDGVCYDVDGEDAHGIYVTNNSSPIITDNVISRIFGGAGASSCFAPYSGAYTDGGSAVGIHIDGGSSPTITNNTLSVVNGGAIGGIGAGIYLSASSAAINGNEISLVNGGSSGRSGRDGGLAAGVYIQNGLSLTIDSNVISSIHGGAGADGWTEGFCRGGKPTGDGGVGTGIYTINSSSLNTTNNVISEIKGGEGGRGNPGCYYAGTSGPGGKGGIGAGIHAAGSTFLDMTNNIISGLQGGGGGDGVPAFDDKYPPVSGGNGGAGIGIYAEPSSATLMNNTVVSSAGGLGGAPGDPNVVSARRVGDSTDDAQEFANGEYDDDGPYVLLGDENGVQNYVGFRFYEYIAMPQKLL